MTEASLMERGQGRVKRWIEVQYSERWDCVRCGLSYICHLDAGCVCGATVEQVPGRWAMYNTGEWINSTTSTRRGE